MPKKVFYLSIKKEILMRFFTKLGSYFIFRVLAQDAKIKFFVNDNDEKFLLRESKVRPISQEKEVLSNISFSPFVEGLMDF